MAASTGLVNAKLDERSYQRALKRLEKYEGRPLRQRMEAAFMAGGRLTVAPMRRAAPRVSGRLSSKVTTRKGRPSSGFIVRVGTKSRAPHAGLVAQGHRIVTPGGRNTGQRAKANPFVSQVIGAYEGRVIEFIGNAVAKEGIGAFGSMEAF